MPAGNPASGVERTAQRMGRPMALNYGGDSIVLFNDSGEVVDEVTYGDADEGEELIPTAKTTDRSGPTLSYRCS